MNKTFFVAAALLLVGCRPAEQAPAPTSEVPKAPALPNALPGAQKIDLTVLMAKGADSSYRLREAALARSMPCEDLAAFEGENDALESAFSAWLQESDWTSLAQNDGELIANNGVEWGKKGSRGLLVRRENGRLNLCLADPRGKEDRVGQS